MNNPYANEQETVDFRIGRPAAYTFIFLFLLLITLPPLYRNLSGNFAPIRALFSKKADQTITTHLRGAEAEIEDAPFTAPVRRAVQTALTRGPLHDGNSKTHIGKDGWLYFRTALDALTGYGPLRPEPDSVAKDPNRKPWKSPLAAITTFANQLAETDTELLLVPIPVKPMIYPEHLGIGTDNPITPPDAEPFYAKIAALENVEIADLATMFHTVKRSDEPLFLKQDTHWTPAGMGYAVSGVGDFVSNKDWFQQGAKIELGTDFTRRDELAAEEGELETRSSPGDLVEKFDIGSAGYPDESVEVSPITGNTRDPRSPIVLLGDSFTNIYSDTSGLGWGANAGFAEHLAYRLGTPLDVIAINGGGATEVREALARRRGAATLMKDKKLVIWAIAARDLFLSESAAKKADVEWGDVTFDTRDPASGVEYPTRVRAELVARPELPDPNTTAYKNLLYVAEYRLLETLGGDTPPETEESRFLVAHWAFKERQLLPTADYRVGDVRVMKLENLDAREELQSVEQRNDSDLFLDILWDTAPPPTPTGSGAASHLLPTTGCALWAVLLGIGLRRSARRGLSR